MTFLKKFLVLFTGQEKCVCCNSASLDIPLCKKCLKKFIQEGKSVFQDRNKYCMICGKNLVSELKICSSCRNERVVLSCDGVFPVQTYRLWKKELLFCWKMQEKRQLSRLFAGIFFEALKQVSALQGKSQFLPVVPVPPRPGKIRKKGWDQIDDICFYLKWLYGVKVYNLLLRLSKMQQKKLGRESRLELIQKGYVLKPAKKIKKICGELPSAVILIDDVMTTGSTVEACTKLLKSAGIDKVFVITLFVVD